MAAAVGQNASVEEILASIRQAISEDDSRRTSELQFTDPPANTDRRPPMSATNESPSEMKPGSATGTVDSQSNDVSTEADPADQHAIERAIEEALNGVRAELEAVTPKPAQRNRFMGGGSTPAAGQRTVPRASRVSAIRREGIALRRSALLSPDTDAHVAASFDDLAKAMMGGNARKLDEVVEEMLRPMLKSWLEGNLPQMVERLVREEIERVARGRR